jgi:peptide methionine sulfoxide reductase msrA/msrB
VSRRRRSVTGALVAAALVSALLSGCGFLGLAGNETRSVDATTLANIRGGEDVATIYLAGGCFWGVEKYMSEVNGVLNAEAGYANGNTDSPTYGDVSSGRSGYTETVRVDYDSTVAPLPFLLDLFYKAIDPTSLNRQGNDVGTQYRSGIYYSDPADRAVIERSLAQLQEGYDKPIAVEARPLTSYTPAEEYHQDYLDKNPGGYCHISPGLFKDAAAAKPDASQLPTAGAGSQDTTTE